MLKIFASSSFALSIVLFFTFLVFTPTLQGQWTNWDDNRHLLDNSSLRSLDLANLKNIFTQSVNKTYIPLTTLSFAVEYHFVQLKPFLYHFDNLLLHLGIVSLVFLFSLQMGLPRLAAVLAALLFGIHPMHVESVAWITERKDVLYGFFYMLALWCYVRYVKRMEFNFYISSVIFGLLSILAKPMAISLPLVLLICDWFLKRPFLRKVILEKIPHFLIAGIIGSITYVENSRILSCSFPKSFLIWIWSLTFYIRKFFVPDYFIPLYRLPKPVALSQPEFVVSVVVFAVIILSFFYFYRSRLWWWAWLFFGASVFFILRMDDAAFDVTFVADRFMYLPSLGFCMLLGVAGSACVSLRTERPPEADPPLAESAVNQSKITSPARLLQKPGRASQKMLLAMTRVIISILIFCVFVFLFIKTFKQCQVWRNSLALWNHVIHYSPEEELAFNSRAVAYYQSGQINLALADLTTAIVLNPNNPTRYNNRGLIYNDLKRYDLALVDFNRAIELDGKFTFAYNNRGMIYDKMHQSELALRDYNKALSLNPQYAFAYSNRGIFYKSQGKYDLAFNDFQKALTIDSSNWQVYYNFGNLFSLQGNYQLAVEYYSKALAISPDFTAARLQREKILSLVSKNLQ